MAEDKRPDWVKEYRDNPPNERADLETFSPETRKRLGEPFKPDKK